MGDDVALRLRSISKQFGGVAALSDVSLELRRGEILGLVGENGSGKSTLVKIIVGFHQPERGAEGEIWGKPISFPVLSPGALGIAAIHQDLGLVDELTVMENLGVSLAYGARGLRPVRWGQEAARCRAELERFGVDLDPHARVSSLSPAERATVAIVRAARELRARSLEGEIFILDEPTAYLTRAEAERVLALMRAVADAGSSVIFISHHLSEVTQICDRVVVLRDGRLVADIPNENLSELEVIAHMLGRELESFYPDKIPPPSGSEVALSVQGLSGRVARDVSFDVRRGELLGVTGLAGMGQQELPYLMAGVARPEAGGVARPPGPPVVHASPGDARRAGIVLVPGNRSRDGVWPLARASENITLPYLRDYFRGLRLRGGEEAARSHELMAAFQVDPPDEAMRVKSFSGGNQQKIVLAKWLQHPQDVLLLDEPTQGVDAGARREILAIVSRVAEEGAAVVMFSSDFEQLAAVCTRVLVLSRGRVVASVEGADVSEDNLLALCQTA